MSGWIWRQTISTSGLGLMRSLLPWFWGWTVVPPNSTGTSRMILSLGPEGYDRSVTASTVSKLCHQGLLTQAVEALEVLVHADCCISKSLFYTVLKRCVMTKDLVLGRRVHCLTVKKGYKSDKFLCNHILRMYACHGRLQDAMDVFTLVAAPDAFMWSSIISAHVKHGLDTQAIQLYLRMRRSSVKADGHVFVAALQACARGADLQTGQLVHADVVASGLQSDLFVSSCLVDMYAKCGSLEDAQGVFDGLGQKTVVMWNTMIGGYARQGMGQAALALYSVMQQEGHGAVPDPVTFLCLLQACASVGNSALEKGRQIHVQIREKGHESDVFVANSLVNMYAKCGSLEDAERAFDGLAQKDVVTWTALISGYSQQGKGVEALRLHSVMQEEGIAILNSMTFVSLLQACAGVGAPALDTGKQLHAQIIEQGHEGDVFVANNLVNMYAKCGSLEDARGVFDRLGPKNVVTWSAMIAGYSQQGRGNEALGLYKAMQQEGVSPNSVTFVCLLQACAAVGTTALEMGKQLHAQIREQGLDYDDIVVSSLVKMYAECVSLEDVDRVFDSVGAKDDMTWTALIAGYSQHGKGHEALRLYTAMQEDGITVFDSATVVCLLQACATVGIPALELGRQLHTQVRKQGLEADVFIAKNLVDMYAKCGSLDDAQRVFAGLCHKDVVTWNAMIARYSQQGMGQEALHLYTAMQEEGLTVPDSVTFVCLLQACASVGSPALEKGKQLHAEIRNLGLQADVFLASSLMNMYTKCGSLENAQRVFDGVGERDVVVWNTMIAGCSQRCMGEEALHLFRRMEEEGIAVPNSVTYVCLLQACANLAALHVGRQLHAQIEERGLQADPVVAHSLINMYGKSGSMVDAQQVFEALAERNVVTWNALIAGYSHQGCSEEVFDLVLRMQDEGIQPDGITFLGVLTVCSHTGLVNKGREYFDAMSRHHSITPKAEHFACMVDLLGRAGRLDDALALVSTMPVEPNSAVWHSLLGACRMWSNMEVGRHAFNQAVKLDKNDAAAYALMSNMYRGAQMWEQAQELQDWRIRTKAWKQPGQSWWTDTDGFVHSFLVETNHQRLKQEALTIHKGCEPGVGASVQTTLEERRSWGSLPRMPRVPIACS